MLEFHNIFYMSLKSKSERIIYYDFIRAFAIFGILACHCFVGLVENVNIFNTPLWHYSLFLYSLREVCIPLFVCVSGALLIAKKDSLTVFIKKRFIRIIPPYVFWIVTFILSSILFQNITNPNNLIFETISIPPIEDAVFFWFVQMIIIVYVVIFALSFVKLLFNELN